MKTSEQLRLSLQEINDLKSTIKKATEHFDPEAAKTLYLLEKEGKIFGETFFNITTTSGYKITKAPLVTQTTGSKEPEETGEKTRETQEEEEEIFIYAYDENGRQTLIAKLPNTIENFQNFTETNLFLKEYIRYVKGESDTNPIDLDQTTILPKSEKTDSDSPYKTSIGRRIWANLDELAPTEKQYKALTSSLDELEILTRGTELKEFLDKIETQGVQNLGNDAYKLHTKYLPTKQHVDQYDNKRNEYLKQEGVNPDNELSSVLEVLNNAKNFFTKTKQPEFAARVSAILSTFTRNEEGKISSNYEIPKENQIINAVKYNPELPNNPELPTPGKVDVKPIVLNEHYATPSTIPQHNEPEQLRPFNSVQKSLNTARNAVNTIAQFLKPSFRNKTNFADQVTTSRTEKARDNTSTR